MIFKPPSLEQIARDINRVHVPLKPLIRWLIMNDHDFHYRFRRIIINTIGEIQFYEEDRTTNVIFIPCPKLRDYTYNNLPPPYKEWKNGNGKYGISYSELLNKVKEMFIQIKA